MLKVAPIFGDNMVLQRNKENYIWGKGVDGDVVEIDFLRRTYLADVENGIWKVKLAAVDAGGPYTMDITCKEEKLHFQNILIGEVWFAGGQSNMELELQNSDNGKAVSEQANRESIRFFNVPKLPYIDEDFEKKYEDTGWQIMKGRVCDTMSAVAFYFANKVYDSLRVPIGIIDCYWGGTSALSWVSEEMIQTEPAASAAFMDYQKQIESKSEEEYEAELAAFEKEVADWDAKADELRKVNPDILWSELCEKLGDNPWEPPMGKKSPYRPCGLHETMVMQVAPYGIRGFLYYQGESDETRSRFYGKLNSMVIRQWRKDFEDEDLDFYLTQLPMFIADGAEDDKNWCIVREQQKQVTKDNKRTHMAVIIDCGEYDNIHPTDKTIPGERLALQVLGKTYGRIKEYNAMGIENVEYQDGKMIVHFHSTYGGIHLWRYKDQMTEENKAVVGWKERCEKPEKIYGFEVSDDGEHYVEAEGEIISDEAIALWSPELENPIHVRYAWSNFCVTNVYNNADLPLVPFSI